MLLQYSNHALLRMGERQITADEINEVFNNPYLAYQKHGYTIIGKTDAGRYITLVINMTTHVLITLWPAKRKERALYEKKIA